MKRGVSLALMVWVVLCLLSGCGGNVRNVERLYAPSSLYSQEEIDAAMDVAIRYFKKEFSGCTLTQIQYPGRRCGSLCPLGRPMLKRTRPLSSPPPSP